MRESAPKVLRSARAQRVRDVVLRVGHQTRLGLGSAHTRDHVLITLFAGVI